MTWILLISLLIILGSLAVVARKQVHLMYHLLYRSSSSSSAGEWFAPEDITRDVQIHYLEAIEWLASSILADQDKQQAASAVYLSGKYLEQHQAILNGQKSRPPMYVGIMRSTHQLRVQDFSAGGERCLLIDEQESRRIATYDYLTHERQGTQDMGNGTIVYEMVYDNRQKRWKINRFVQELPPGWNTKNLAQHIELLSELPHSIGRDN